MTTHYATLVTGKGKPSAEDTAMQGDFTGLQFYNCSDDVVGDKLGALKKKGISSALQLITDEGYGEVEIIRIETDIVFIYIKYPDDDLP